MYDIECVCLCMCVCLAYTLFSSGPSAIAIGHINVLVFTPLSPSLIYCPPGQFQFGGPQRIRGSYPLSQCLTPSRGIKCLKQWRSSFQLYYHLSTQLIPGHPTFHGMTRRSSLPREFSKATPLALYYSVSQFTKWSLS